jgi:16S rRNA processing protein RimM
MNKVDCQYIGRFTKLHGNQGNLVLKFDDNLIFRTNKMELIFIEFDGKLVPFFISKNTITEKSGNTILLHLDDVDTDPIAKELLNKEIFVPKSSKSIKNRKNIHIKQITGFEVIDEKHGSIGFIDHLIENPSNPLLSILQNQKEILLPLADEFILDIDFNSQKFFVRIPEGLLNLYI